MHSIYNITVKEDFISRSAWGGFFISKVLGNLGRGKRWELTGCNPKLVTFQLRNRIYLILLIYLQLNININVLEL